MGKPCLAKCFLLTRCNFVDDIVLVMGMREAFLFPKRVGTIAAANEQKNLVCKADELVAI